MLATCDVEVVRGPTQIVHLTEMDVPNSVWVLDIRASNHMTRMQLVLT